MEIKLQTAWLFVVNLLNINEWHYVQIMFQCFIFNYSDINNWIKYQIVSLCNNDAYPTCVNKYHSSFLRFCFKKNLSFWRVACRFQWTAIKITKYQFLDGFLWCANKTALFKNIYPHFFKHLSLSLLAFFQNDILFST